MRLNILISGLACAGFVLAAQAEDKKPADAWDSKLVIGANAARGNSEVTTVTAGILGDRKLGSNEMHLGLEGNYGATDITQADGSSKTDTSAQNAHAFATYRRLLDERTFVSPLVDLTHDKIAYINYRLMAGAAVGRYLIKSDNQNLSAELGADFIREEIAGYDDIDSMTDNRGALRIAQRYDVKLKTGAKIWEAVEYLPTFDNFGRYLMNAEIGAETAMTEHINIRVVVQDKYNSRPPDAKKSNDLLVTAGLSWAL